MKKAKLTIAINKQTNKNPNHLKSLEIVLRAYDKRKKLIEENILKLGKNSKNLCHLNHFFSPSLLSA